MINIRKLESELWESADLLRSSSKLTSNQYCMPVMGLIFLRYAYSRFKAAEMEILKDRPSRGGRILPVEASDFKERSALFLPKEAQYDYLLNLPGDIASADIKNINGEKMNSLGEVVNNAMQLVEDQSELLKGVLPKDYTIFSDELLSDLLCIFNNSALNDVGGDVIGRIYEYFLNKFAKNIASDDGVFFTPKSLVKMIVNVIEPKKGILLDPACGSGGMFIQSGDFVTAAGKNANSAMSFYGQEKVEYNAQLCLMNMAVHGLSGRIRSGDEANTFYHDAYNLCGKCDYVMANPPFNVDKVKSESCTSAGRLPFGQPAVNKSKEFGNANYLWISYFYAYLNEHGRAGFVMASSATDSQSKDKDIREKLIKTGHVDVMVSVGNNFFYTKSLQCSLWFFDKNKSEAIRNKVLFIDTRNYYTVIDRTLNEWSEWQLKNLNAIVWLYRGEIENYQSLIQEYKDTIYRYTYESTDKELDDILSNYGSFSELS
ncbi:MAG: SAM-dependent DNA methyltransferase, partial [Clostridia bacterium]|nr:SAM-dependent DNA methyltransferase [Clostridia bacterium]